MKKLYALIVALLWLAAARAQTYYFRHYQTESGLSHNSAFCMMQDRRGFMWFGTRDGLNRFDGYTFKTFRYDAENPKSIGSNFIYSLYQDKKGIIWVGTSKGLYQYDEVTESFNSMPYTAGHGVGLVRDDDRGNLWFVQDQTLIRYNRQQNTFHPYPQSRYFMATVICIDKNQDLWVATTAGKLEKYNPLKDDFTAIPLFSHSGTTTSQYISALYDTGLGSLLVGTTNQGVKLFDIGTGTYRDLLTYNSDKTELYVREFIKSAEGEFWIATESGIYIYNINTGLFKNLKKDVTNPYAISDNAVYSLCRDNEGGLWAGTYFGGVNYFSSQYTNFEKYFAGSGANELKGSIVREICQDGNKNLWIGTEDAGLNKFNPATGQFKHFSPDGSTGSISYSNIHALLVDGNRLWIGTYEHGLDIMDLHTEKVVKHYIAGSGLHSNFIVTICRTRNGDFLVGTSLGLYKYNAAADGFDLISQVPPRCFVYGVLEDAQGLIWVATLGNGIYCYNPNTGKTQQFTYRPGDSSSLSSNSLTGIFQDSRHQLWFTTEDGGLNKYLPKTHNFQRFTTKDGFPSNFLFKILEDDYGRLWITTTKGLVCFNPENNKLTTFTQANGLLSDQFNYNSGFKDDNGRLYFGCIKGFVRFSPNEFRGGSYQPKVYITGLQIDNKEAITGAPGSPLEQSITTSNNITLKPDQTSISIDFAALNYSAPQMTQYAYKMDGLDNTWTYLKTNRKVYFTKLPSGHYTFRIKVLNSNGASTPDETILNITILPPFYASTWAYLFYFIVVVAAIYYLVQFYHRQTEEKNRRKIELLENEMSKEVYQAKIEFFTNITHEIRTPLTLIKAPLEKVAETNNPAAIKDYVEVMQRNTNRLLTLTDQLLDFRKTEIKGFKLNFVRSDVRALLRETFRQFSAAAAQQSVEFILHVPDEPVYAYADVEAMHKMLGNIIGNALKYAGKQVSISLELAVDQFIITAKNDGDLVPAEMKEKIFEPFFRISETSKHNGTGIGLPLTRSLASLHRGTFEFIPTDDGLNTFVLTLPVHQEVEFDLYDDQSANERLETGEIAETEQSQPLIMLAEDNKDIQDFIQRELSQHYRVIKASNGQIALDMLGNQMPDLIISDIMMPVMDGLELCNAVKTNVDYSHIPVILLTAKNTLQSKIEGLEQGADAYIEKPFSPGHLMAQIASILRNRDNVREHFARSPLAHIKTMAVSKADEAFLEALNNAIYAQLDNINFDVDQLADALNMGRRTLFRKIKAISNLTPAEMITLARLKKAAEYLAEGQYRIYEIADLVGFSSSTVFTRIFQKQFGMTPTEYANFGKQTKGDG